MENKSNDETIKEIVEKLKGKSYSEITGILERVKWSIEVGLKLN